MTDQEILTEVQYTVVEPPNGGSSWPSGLWQRDEVVGSLSQRQDRFLKDTLAVIQHATEATAENYVPPINPAPLHVVIGQTRVTVPVDVIRLVTVVWLGSDGTVRELLRSDSFETDHVIPSWETVEATPLVYMEFDPLLHQVQIAPAPAVDGSLDILYVPLGTPLTGNGVDLTLPDECAHATKYGTLADLLSKDGRAKDTGRAQYAEQRYQLAVEATRIILKGWS